MTARFPHPSEANSFLADHIRLLRVSLRRLTGTDLCDPSLDDTGAARWIFRAPFAVVSHDTAADPVFNYANQMALDLFEMTWDEFTSLPSRKSAETPDRDERARLLAEVTAKGCIQNYTGVRISKSGRRFRIENATVWNLANDEGHPRGQAAIFARWKTLPDT
jgi:hypothetical protein